MSSSSFRTSGWRVGFMARGGFPSDGSEYGGYPDLIQPEPHNVADSVSDQLLATYATDPADSEDSVEKQVDIIRARGRRNVGR